MKAIETEYCGVSFRSRLEARWAMLLDKIGVKWLYETEGYQLKSGWYVPDFLLTNVGHKSRGGTWLEIKGQEPTENERLLCIELAFDVVPNRDVFLAVGFGGIGTGLWFPVQQHRSDPREFKAELLLTMIRANKARDSIDAAARMDAAVRECERHRFWNPRGHR